MDTNKIKPEAEIIAESLQAAAFALNHALEQAQKLRHVDEGALLVPGVLIQALCSVKEAKASDLMGSKSFFGHVANSVSQVRTAMKMVNTLATKSDVLYPTSRALKRGLELLTPFVQSPKAGLLRASSRLRKSRRSRPVSQKLLPLFDINYSESFDTNFFTGFEHNIKNGGLFIATYDIYPIDSRLIVKLRLPNRMVLAENARVSWIREYSRKSPEISPGIGVVFDHLMPADEHCINSYLEGCETLFFETG